MSLTLPPAPDARARLAELLAADRVALVPERSVRLRDDDRLGWWLIDPWTGQVPYGVDDASPVAAALGGLSAASAAAVGTAFMGDPNLAPKGVCQ
jgi:hypothetical protein